MFAVASVTNKESVRLNKVSWKVPPWSVFKASKVGAYLSGTLLPYYHRRKRIGTNTLAYFIVVSVTRKESVYLNKVSWRVRHLTASKVGACLSGTL